MKVAGKEIRLAYLNMLVNKLWIKGLLTDEEKKKIIKLNEEKIN